MHDNARCHSSKATTDFLKRRSVRMIKQSPYSPDLNMCEMGLQRAQKHLRNVHLKNNSEVEKETLRWFKSLPRNRFVKELNKLIDDCNRIILLNGEYIS